MISLNKLLTKRNLNISVKLIPEWPDLKGRIPWITPPVTMRYKNAIETFKLEDLLRSSIVQNNLALLSKTNLKKAAMLDFGCGSGVYKTLIANYPYTKDWTYVGADISANLVEICRAAYPDVRFEISDNGKLPFHEGEFDIVLASGVLQYIKDYTATLKELKRITKKYIVITRLPVWKDNRSAMALQTVRHNWGEESYPLHILNRNELKSEFMHLGLTSISQDYGDEFYQIPGVFETTRTNNFILGVN